MSPEPRSSTAPLGFAVVSPSDSTAADLAVVCEALSKKIDRAIQPLVMPSYAAMHEEVAAGRAHVIWAPPLVAIELVEAGLGSIELCVTRGGGHVDYHAALFTSHASRFETLADLKGARVAWVDVHSASGYVLPRKRIAVEGLDPDTLFGEESFLGTHARVACAVLAGEADVGATHVSLDPRTGRPLSAGWLDAGAGINGAFVLATAGPIPTDAIVLSNEVDAATKEALAAEISGVHAAAPAAVERLFQADGFAVTASAHFDALRALMTKK